MATGTAYTKKAAKLIFRISWNIPIHWIAAVAMAGQTGGAVRVVLDFLFLLYQDKRKEYNLAAFNYNEN